MKFIIFLIAIVGAVWASAGWMTVTAQAHFDHRLVNELLPPDGAVYTAIHREMMVSQPLTKKEAEAMKHTIDLMRRQDIRSNLMLERVYIVTTGDPLPPRITE